MGDSTISLLAVLGGMIIAVPILLLFRSTGTRGRCWRCHVNMLPLWKRVRTVPLLPLGHCEGCAVICLALGPRRRPKKHSSRSWKPGE